MTQKRMVSLGPAFLRVRHDNGVIGVGQFVRHGGQLGDFLALATEPDTSAAHEDIEGLGERTLRVDRQIGAVEPREVLALQRLTGSHQGTHRGHDLELEDRVLHLALEHLAELVLRALVEEVDIALDCFLPSLAPTQVIAPT